MTDATKELIIRDATIQSHNSLCDHINSMVEDFCEENEEALKTELYHKILNRVKQRTNE